MNSDDSVHSLFQNTISYNGSSKILLVTIIAFSIIITIIFTYHLYDRFVLRRRRSTFSAVSQPPKRGLDSLIIASLPKFIIGVNADVAARECAVCLSLFDENDMVRMLPNCKHMFHVTCVDTWLVTRSTCPICRSEVEPSVILELEPREGPIGESAPIDIRLDSVRRVLSRERSLNRNDNSRVDQDRVMDLERQ